MKLSEADSKYRAIGKQNTICLEKLGVSFIRIVSMRMNVSSFTRNQTRIILIQIILIFSVRWESHVRISHAPLANPAINKETTFHAGSIQIVK